MRFATLALLLMCSGASAWAQSTNVCPQSQTGGPTYTDPGSFTTPIEVLANPSSFDQQSGTFLHASAPSVRQPDQMVIPVGIITEVDTLSTLALCFDEGKMDRPAAGAIKVTIRVEVDLFKGETDTPLVVNGFSTKSTQSTGGPLTYTPKSYDPDPMHRKEVPNAYVNLRFVKDLASQDKIVVRVTNDETQQQVVYELLPRELGLHFKTLDSMMMIQRLNVTATDVAKGVSKINFAPSPGVTFGGTFMPRKNRLFRLLGVGAGINVSFLDWKDQSTAFDASTGKFAAGTKSSNINVGVGLQGWLFSGAVQVVYGRNLQADQARNYWGIGISFVNVYQKINSLVGTGK